MQLAEDGLLADCIFCVSGIPVPSPGPGMDQAIRISDWSDYCLSWAQHWHTHFFAEFLLVSREVFIHSWNTVWEPYVLGSVQYIVNPLHTNLLVENFQRCEPVFRQRPLMREWNCSLPSVSWCWRSFSSTISHLLSVLQAVTSLACSLDASPCMPVVVLFKILNYKFKNVLCFLCLFFMYYLCGKYYKPITIQYYVVDCVSCVSRLILLDFWINWAYKCVLRMELIRMQGTCCTGNRETS